MNDMVPLGDQGVLAYFPDESAALQFAANVRQHPPPWLVDVVGAYTAVAVFFDLERIDFAQVVTHLKQRAPEPQSALDIQPMQHRIPCCYERGADLARVAKHSGLSVDEVIRLHVETEYTVYAIGFCPGFPYLGYLPPSLCGVPRLESPRVRVAAGSVGLTGRQTGIYTETRPGGWNLVGETPLELVNVADGYFPLRTGDRVHFARIDEKEFHRMKENRLRLSRSC
jgi:inhibitor of KinA